MMTSGDGAWVLAAWVFCSATGSGSVDPGTTDGPAATDGSTATDASTEASTDAMPVCDPLARFDAPVPIPALATPALNEAGPRLSADELTLYFSGTATGATTSDLYVARRETRTAPFDEPTLMMAHSSPALDVDPAVSSDGLTLWFASDRVANQPYHLYVATRGSVLAEFGLPGLAANVNASDLSQSDAQPFVTADGSELWFGSSRTPTMGGYDLWRAPRSGAGFGTPVRVAELGSSAHDWFPTPSADRLTIYISSNRTGPGTRGGFDVWRARRTTVNDGFAAPTLVEELSTAGDDRATWLSADGCRMYGGVNGDIFVATRAPAR